MLKINIIFDNDGYSDIIIVDLKLFGILIKRKVEVIKSGEY